MMTQDKDAKNKITVLEKENEELKERIDELEDRICKLELASQQVVSVPYQPTISSPTVTITTTGGTATTPYIRTTLPWATYE